MATDLNRVILIGRLTHDPESKITPRGKSVCNFSLAVNDRNGVNYIRCTAWEKTAEIVQKYCKKGKQIAVEGRIQTRNWEDANGKKQYMTEIVLETIKLLGGQQKSEFDHGFEPDDDVVF